MNCRHVEQRLSDYFEGLVSKRAADQIQAHLEACPACRRLREEHTSLRSELQGLAQQMPPSAPDLERRSVQRWQTGRGRRVQSSGLRAQVGLPCRLAAGACGAALLVGALSLAATRWRGDGGEARIVSKPAGSNREQIQVRAPLPLPRKREESEKDKGTETIRKPGMQEGKGSGLLASGVPQAPVPAPSALPRLREREEAPRLARHGLEDDLAVLNGEPEGPTRRWAVLSPAEWQQVEDRVRSQVRVKDDFVTIPFPRLAATSPRQIAAAAESYKREAVIVDGRLAREVTVQQKAAALSDLCERLRGETGIHLAAGPSVTDEKVTLFCQKQPLRDVMRQLSRPFGYTWLRSGKPGEYKYELVQDLKSQLLEEELRNQDVHAAMLAMDQQMGAYQPYLNLSMDELRTRLARASGPEKSRLQKLRSNWGAVQAYHRLTPAQHLALLNGERLEFSLDAPDPDRRLPPEWRQELLESSFLTLFNLPPVIAGNLTGKYPPETPVAQLPGAMPTVSLRIDRSELGQLALMVGSGLYFVSDPTARTGMGPADPLALGQNPSATKPDNAGANHERRKEPFFQRIVSFRPTPSCPRFAPKVKQPNEEKSSSFATPNSLGQFAPEPAHVSTADVWEAVHRATGLNILADSYSHFYPVPSVTVERRPLFEGLCQVADALGVRWKKEGDFLVCRSASYFSDKLKEVPNRHLARWREDKVKQGGLPLEDLLEMAALSDQQLNSGTVGKVVEHCWGLDEWWLVGKGTIKTGVNPGDLRPVARFLAGLTPAQRRQAQLPEWLAFAALTPAQQQALATLLWSPERTKLDPHSLRFQFAYAPAGTYVWDTLVTADREQEAWRWPMVVGKTREAALAAARRLYPPAAPDQIVPSQGVLWLGLTQADGQSWGIGREPPKIPLTR